MSAPVGSSLRRFSFGTAFPPHQEKRWNLIPRSVDLEFNSDNIHPTPAEQHRLFQGMTQMETKMECALDEIRRIADGAYCASLDKFSSTPCLGFEFKAEHGLFGKIEHDAHAEANRLMGRHFGMYEALRIIRSAIATSEAA